MASARDELAKLEAEQAERNEEIKRKRRELPWVPSRRSTSSTLKTARRPSPSSSTAARNCSPTTSCSARTTHSARAQVAPVLADGLDGALVHLNHRDVTLIGFSRAPIDRLVAYKQRMGWQFPYVSTYDTDFPFDFGLAMTEEQAQQIPEVKEMIDNPPDWLKEWSRQVGAELKDGLREARAGSRSRARTAPCTTRTP